MPAVLPFGRRPTLGGRPHYAPSAVCADAARPARPRTVRTFGALEGDAKQARQSDPRGTIGSVDVVVGIVIGVAFGVIVMGFIAARAYDDGWDAARRRSHLGTTHPLTSR